MHLVIIATDKLMEQIYTLEFHLENKLMKYVTSLGPITQWSV